MAEKYQNGLLLTPETASQCGRTFARWLFEWWTQVVGATAYDTSGATWTSVADSGSDGASVVSFPERFTAASAAWTGSDAGSYITITGMTPTNRDGIYRITRVVSSTVVELDIRYSVHVDGIPTSMSGLTWRHWRPDATNTPGGTDWAVVRGTGTTGGSYSYDVKIIMRTSNSYFPEFEVGPHGNWNNGTHAWDTGTYSYTTARGIDNYSNSIVNVDNARVWACGDTDRVAIMLRCEDDYTSYTFIYIGEIDTFYSSVDPKPVLIFTGGTAGNADGTLILGTGGTNSLNGGGRWLAKDDTTTVNGYLSFAHCSPNNDYHWMSTVYRRWSQFSREMFLQKLICECRTSSYMEHRGTLRRIWITARDYQRLTPFGQNSEYLHACGGLTLQWGAGGAGFGSLIWYERI